ncbi:unnamed protein product [Amoebophrya sp. A120]|nr:unnamed protein product [Amoebophrya sp. A120]|eukprot:GSA120T00008705001.1
MEEGFDFLTSWAEEVHDQQCNDPSTLKKPWDSNLVRVSHEFHRFPPDVSIGGIYNNGFATSSQTHGQLASTIAKNHRYGIFGHTRTAWMTDDHILYLWNYARMTSSSSSSSSSSSAIVPMLLNNHAPPATSSNGAALPNGTTSRPGALFAPNGSGARGVVGGQPQEMYATSDPVLGTVNIVPADSIILSVAMVQPRENAFGNRIHFLIVVVTQQNVHLLGVVIRDSRLHTVNLPGYSCSTNGHPFSAVHSTEDGRILLSSLRYIYELEYDNDANVSMQNYSATASSLLSSAASSLLGSAFGGSSSFCRLNCITGGVFSNFLFNRSSKATIKQFAVAQANFFVTVDEDQVLTVYGCGNEQDDSSATPSMPANGDRPISAAQSLAGQQTTSRTNPWSRKEQWTLLDLENQLQRKMQFHALQSREFIQLHVSNSSSSNGVLHIFLLTSAYERIHLRYVTHAFLHGSFGSASSLGLGGAGPLAGRGLELLQYSTLNPQASFPRGYDGPPGSTVAWIKRQ